MAPAKTPGLEAELRALIGRCASTDAASVTLDGVCTGLRLAGERVADRPIRPAPIRALLGEPGPAAVLSPLASKYGGRAYLESEDDWPRANDGEPYDFVGQLYFDELPTVGTALPARGMFVLFQSPGAEPDERSYLSRWYPAPSAARAVDARGRTLARWECRIRATPAPSVCLDPLAALAARLERPSAAGAAVERLFEDLVEWLSAHGADCGAWLPAALAGPGPRAWMERGGGFDEPWMLLWTPSDPVAGLDHGSMECSIMVRPEDLALGRLERAVGLRWQ